MSQNLVRKATIEDAPEIIAVCNENLIANNQHKTAADFSQSGFLMSQISVKNIEETIVDKDGALLLVAQNNDKICGYLTAYDISKADKLFHEELNQIKELQGSKIIYYRQIAKKSGIPGVGRDLILQMFVEAKSQNYDVIACRIVFEPFYNEASIRFHEKHGFQLIKTVKEQNRIVGIYIKNL